jgi:hypothetical protein
MLIPSKETNGVDDPMGDVFVVPIGGKMLNFNDVWSIPDFLCFALTNNIKYYLHVYIIVYQ